MFLNAVAPSIMPRETATVVFAQVITDLRSAVGALIVFAVCLLVGTWFAGGTRSALAVRRVGNRAFGSVRTAADRQDLSTGRFGQVLERWHTAIITIDVAAES